MPVIPGLTRKQLGGELIPEGTYALRIHQAKFVTAAEGKDAKFDYINLDCVVTEEGDFFGRHIFQNVTLKPAQAFLAAQIEEALGFDELHELNNDEWLDGELMGVVTIEKGKQGYSDRNHVKKFLAP